MTRQDLRLWYKRETGKEIPIILIDMRDNEIEDCENYIEWLEEGLMATKQIAENLHSEIITIKNKKL